MRTALILLFLLAVAAVPGSILPQRPLNPDKTASYIKDHGSWGPFLDRLGLFDVFGSAWFAAIYLLLFVSLIGCLIPRIRVHARAMLRQPLPAPRHLRRLPQSGSFESSAVAGRRPPTALRGALGRRWRVARREEDSGALTLSAEKGYSRETGNLIFHVALLLTLVLIAVGRLYSYQSTTIVVQGDGFCNGTFPDSWKPGRLAAEGKIHPAPFCIDQLTTFTAKYTDTGEPTSFSADVRYHLSPSDTTPRQASISVNHPLRIEGDRVYLLSHGFAPRITVRMPDGTTRTDTAGLRPHQRRDALLRGRVQGAGQAGRQPGRRCAGLLRADAAGPRQRRHHLGLAAGQPPRAGRVRLRRQSQLHRSAAVGVLPRHQQAGAYRRRQPGDRADPHLPERGQRALRRLVAVGQFPGQPRPVAGLAAGRRRWPW